MAVAKGGMEQQNKQSLSELMFSEPMKRATKLLVSVSVFSVIVSYISWRSHPLLSLALDKNYMFLVCNGILVLLAKTSGRLVLRSGPAVFDDGDVHAPPPHAKLLDSLLHKESVMESRLLLLENADSNSDVLEEEEEEEKHVIEEEKHVIEEEEEEEEEEEGEEREDEDSRSLMTMMIVGDKQEEEGDDDDDDDELEELDNGVFIEAENEVAAERERLNKLSAEELNKKFEEFIKKMKEDIRVEAQQQHLVLVK